MVSIMASPYLAVKSSRFGLHCEFPVVSSPVVCKRRQGLVLVLSRIGGFGVKEVRKSVCCKGWESEGELGLEGEIFQFMKKSKKPNEFPTKKELVEAGRMDLVEGIVKEGGWLSLGWELDDGNEELESDFDVEDFQRRVESCQGSNSFEEEEASRFTDGPGSFDPPSPPTTSSGRALDASEHSGIEGILRGLEKQRNLYFGIDLPEKGYGSYVFSTDVGTRHLRTSTDLDRVNHGKSSRNVSVSPEKSLFDNLDGQLSHNGPVSSIDDSRNSVKPDAWRTWSTQRAGSNTEFEAAEIYLHKKGEVHDIKDEMVAVTQDNAILLGRHREFDSKKIRSRLQHLERELSSALCSLRSKSEKLTLEGDESTSSDMQELSDAWEFQENEFMNARDRLRSIRAKLAILDGKMTLAVIDAQKIVEEKQKRISGAQRALQLLRSACIVWPNSASEVLLAGSFDGWTTQRKMEKSRSGIFSVFLQLYPGRYEIKFVVDGEWRIDPLRPIVNNNGHENNILLIS